MGSGTGRCWVSALLLFMVLTGCDRQPEGTTQTDQRAAVAGVLSDQCDGTAPQPDTLPGAESVTYAHPGDRDLRLHLFQPVQGQANGKPAILFFFGGSWRTGNILSFKEQADAFAAKGYVAVLADYRVKCRDGSNPVQSVNDAQAAYEWLHDHAGDHGIDPRHIILAGGSAGGHLALVTALKAGHDHKPLALVLFNPPVDLVTPAPLFLKPLAWWISPSRMAMGDLPPTLILHGGADSQVPIASVRAFCDHANDTGRTCRLMEYEGQAHGFYHSHVPDPVTGRSPYEDTLGLALDFVQQMLAN